MDKNAIAVAKYYEAKAWLLMSHEHIDPLVEWSSTRDLIRQMSSQWALVAYRNFSKAQKLTPEDGALSGFESEIEVLKCMSDLYKNQKLDSNFIEGLGHENPSKLK